MTSTMRGALLLGAGIFGLMTVHSKRPPSGFGEAFSRMAAGNDWFLQAPFYQLFMAASAVVAVVGAVKLYQGVVSRDG